MNSTVQVRMARPPSCYAWLSTVLSSALVVVCTALPATGKLLFDAPPTPVVVDEVLLVSTRAVGTVCTNDAMQRGLGCRLRWTDATGVVSWKKVDWRRMLSTPTYLPTIIYVHGNRVSDGRDRREGMQVYRSFKEHHPDVGPVRFVIWSWPSDQIPGPIKDYRVKAQRTNPVAWQLAWLLDKLPAETPISMFGYSYGTRVVSGAAHILAGGKIGAYRLADRAYPYRPPANAVLLAAAYDADWIQPGQLFGRTLEQLDRLVLATNELDPAMRFYHLSNGRGRMHALGKAGVDEISTLGMSRHQLRRVDFTREVGRSHAISDYLAIDNKMRVIWSELMSFREAEWLEGPLISQFPVSR